MDRMNKGSLFSRVTEIAALCAVMHYIFHLFFRSTTFRFVYDDTYLSITFSLLVVLGLTRLFSGLWQEMADQKDWNSVRPVLLKGFLALLTLIPCAAVANAHNYTFVIYLPYVAFCLYGIRPEKVLKVFSVCVGFLLAAVILCALSGAIRNLVYLRKGTWGKMRSSYGICFPTDFASYLVFLLLFVWCAARKKSGWLTAAFVLVALLAAWGILYYTDSKNSALCCLLLAVMVLYDMLQETVLSRHPKTGWIQKTVDFLTAAAFPVFCAVMAGMVWLFGRGTELAYTLNGYLTNRLGQGWSAFKTYGINAVGALTPQTGQGGTVLYDTASATFIDSSYMLLAVRYGWVLLLLVLCLWVWMTRKAIRTGHRRLALAMALIAFHSFTEHHFTELNFNILLAMPLCCFAGKPAALPKKAAPNRKSILSGWISAVPVAGLFVLLLPRLLSVSRCLFALQGWTDGGTWEESREQSLFALLCWLGVLGGLAGLWLALRRLLGDILLKKRVSLAAVGALVLLLGAAGFGAYRVNGVLQQGAETYSADLEEDAPALREVLSAAKEPVYAGSLEELYRQHADGLQSRIFSEEELGRIGRGSLLTESNREGYQLINTGAKYVPISPRIGLFIYDKALAEALGSKGMPVYSYYSAEREENLEVFARLNEAEQAGDGWVRLRGAENPLRYGPYLQQYAGEYAVIYSLRLADPTLREREPDREVCLLRVAAELGENTRAEKILRAGDFDEQGRLTVPLHYNVGDTYGVEFKVYPRDDLEILLNRIAWKRDPDMELQ